jgi:DHA2 family multidrug resistance protein
MTEAGGAPHYPDPATRSLITFAAIAAVMMVTIDGTIAIIALPRIQSSLAASQEQIAWVLTSYLVAGAITTPLSGWLADRFGRIRVMAASVLFFTIASIGCGLSANLEMLVLFRFIQGAAGASLIPLSQILLIDINPPERQGPAIALFGIGTLFGPMIGPMLGGWLTENLSWRAIFLINAPVGIVAFFGLVVFAREAIHRVAHVFDLKGFVAVSIALTAFQLMLDRGQMLDWFASTEVCIEATIAAVFFYLAVVHMLTARHPFIKPAVFRDFNFLIGALLSVLLGILLNGIIPIMTAMMQKLLGYPVLLAGWLSLPRAVGNMLMILVAGRMVSRVDARVLIASGMLMLIASLWMLARLSLDAQQDTLAWIGLLQGCASGLIFLPLTLVVFSTLPQQYRNEGSGIYSLIRNMAGAGGISVIQAMTIRQAATVQSQLVEGVRPDNPVVGWRMPGLDMADPSTLGDTMMEIVRQAEMVAYVGSYQAILMLAIVLSPLCLLLRNPKNATPAGAAPVIHAE